MADSPLTTMHMYAVSVSDQDAAIEFWRDKLGFELRGDQPYGGSYRWVEVAPPGTRTVLALVTPQGPNPRQPGGDTGVSFETDDIEAAHSAMLAQGIDAEEVSRMGDPIPPLFQFRDPDGNRFMVVQLG